MNQPKRIYIFKRIQDIFLFIKSYFYINQNVKEFKLRSKYLYTLKNDVEKQASKSKIPDNETKIEINEIKQKKKKKA